MALPQCAWGSVMGKCDVGCVCNLCVAWYSGSVCVLYVWGACMYGVVGCLCVCVCYVYGVCCVCGLMCVWYVWVGVCMVCVYMCCICCGVLCVL